MAEGADGATVSSGPRSRRRTTVRAGPAPVRPAMPVVVEPVEPLMSPADWAAGHRAEVEASLHGAGAVLLRGFAVDGPPELERTMASLYSTLVAEHERSSPRRQVGGRVFTSTDHPAGERIFLHNEMSYSSTWPMRVAFLCVTPPDTGGETPVADTRAVLRAVPDEIRHAFARRGVQYVRNYGDGFGLPWQTSFGTDDRAAVDAYCRRAGLVAEWKSGDRLRTRRTAPATARHPVTDDVVWFNHATFFHVSTLGPVLSTALLADLGPADVPTNSFYGDGGEIEPEVLDVLRAAYDGAAVSVPWRPGDVLIIDNMLTAHGRSAFTGPRLVVVSMAEPVDAYDCRCGTAASPTPGRTP